MGILMWVVFGAIVGFIADAIDSGTSLNWVERTVVGIVGAVVGGTVATLITTGNLDLTASAGFDLLSMILAVVGALITLFAWKRLFRRSMV